MKYSSPEKHGIKSEWIKEYIQVLEKSKIATHNLIIMRDDHILFEKYWEPFNKDFLHRMYSVTKSFVSLAIGFLEQDGKISLDDPIVKYFPEESKDVTDENVKNQTIRNMLMMSTAKADWGWFWARTNDRVVQYFKNNLTSRPAGTTFSYDSAGSFVLCALVERVTGKSFMEYSREKYLDRIGFSKEAYMLKCPGGHSWGDSALICKATDLLKAAMFCMHKGNIDGQQLLNEEYITAATSRQIDTNPAGISGFDKHGYGYQIWRTYDNSYMFYGIGSQFALCIPDKNIIMVHNGDTQGNPEACTIVIEKFFEIIARRAKATTLDDTGSTELKQHTERLKLLSVSGNASSPIMSKINGITYMMDENPMGITKLKLTFEEDCGILSYTNAQGEKEIIFGMCKNEFSMFPQEGYSDEVGSMPGNRLYKYGASATWVNTYQLFIKVQIIDTYFGTLNITLGFNDDKIGVYMNKWSEDFLDEYNGFAGGKVQNKKNN